ncbi:MFS transporter, partial [Pluralibacter sp.]|uniref:MFS transporter n=1 Tax=Pluralibacter sp. TaxID=1920032 RepID=UPI0025D9FCF0
LLGAADGALLPAVQTLLVYNATNQIAGRVFSYNQSFRDIGNVTGPLIGASVSASYGFRAVFLVTATVVLFNAIYTGLSLRRTGTTALPAQPVQDVEKDDTSLVR